MSRPGRRRAVLAACVYATIAGWIALAGPAEANSGSAAQPDGKPPVSLVITSVSPAYATPGRTVTVSGSITNLSAAAMSGVSVRLRSSSTSLPSRIVLQEYAQGGEPSADSYVPGAITSLTARLAPGATAPWSIKLPVNRVRMTIFGVYPLAAEADSASGDPLPGGTSRTFLPYWPRKHGHYSRPVRQEIAWILPIIDQPRQGACPGLENNGLAASLAPGGRLFELLAAASQAESTGAQLTWAIDPSLLAGVQAMTSPYRVGGAADCRGSHLLHASRAAKTWLAGLKSATRGQPVFITPYADVDIAALTHKSLDKNLADAFTEGRSVASRILRRNFSVQQSAHPGQTAAEQLSGMAWPADGLANHAVLENLAANRISAAVLDSLTMPPPATQGFTPADAVASTPDGVKGDMRVLLSDDTITQVLSDADAPSVPPASAFAVRQRFLAETAMIAAQLPNSSRSIVVAPPRRWDPPAGLASGLLAETASAPWLRPVNLGQLAAATPAQVQTNLQPPASPARGELAGRVLRKVRILDKRVKLLESILVPQDPALNLAVASVESSAWRGSRAGREQAQSLLGQISGYVASQQQALMIIAPLPVTLGGLKGTVPVSIANRMGHAVKVRLKVSIPGDESITVSQPPAKLIPAGTVVNVRLKVHAAAVGSSTIGLGLVTPDGMTLPGTTVAMTIRATHFGTLALVILAAALGVFMITSATRAIRHGRAAPQQADPAHAPHAARAAQADGADGADRPVQDGEADSVVPDDAGPAAIDHDPTEGTDEFARAPGWADRS